MSDDELIALAVKHRLMDAIDQLFLQFTQATTAKELDLTNRTKRAEDALRDLVALEDMRVRLRSQGHGTDHEHYNKGLPKAWDAARAVLLLRPPRINEENNSHD